MVASASPSMSSAMINDADTFFGIELPALSAWTFGAEQAATISKPVLSVLGTDTEPLWIEVADRLRTCSRGTTMKLSVSDGNRCENTTLAFEFSRTYRGWQRSSGLPPIGSITHCSCK